MIQYQPGNSVFQLKVRCNVLDEYYLFRFLSNKGQNILPINRHFEGRREIGAKG